LFFLSISENVIKNVQPAHKGMVPLSDSENWVNDYGDYLYSIAWHRVGDVQIAEDMVQDTFMSALKAADSFEGKSSERTWFVSILKRKIIDYYRKNRRFVRLTQEDDANELPDFQTDGEMKGSWKPEYGPDDWGDNPLKSLEESEFQIVLHQCMSDLPQNLAAIFTIREIEGWKTKEICKEFVDALQMAAARSCSAEYIITRNIKHYKNSVIPAITPQRFIERYH
jgi:RNA polymerase sigma-70 factor (TIGR02943 family)